MRLINTDTIELEEFVDESVPRYGILSHTWGEEEVTFQSMQGTVRPRRKRGWNKIKFACAQAQKDHLTHVWIDTCCIDKRSSAELQEAINSMWKWYSRAEKCYVHIYDISDHCPILEDWGLDEDTDATRWNRVFANCRWFTRGWTLQEMLAPKELAFYGPKWNFIGTKRGLIKTLSGATKVEPSVLTHATDIASMSVAQRMSWAANRMTSRIEDRAYSLLGIFDVNMPLLYGEGSKAFTRLQEEIIKTSTDHSIFAWDLLSYESAKGSLLASSPSNFANCQNIVQWGKRGTFEMTNRGLRIMLPTITAVTDYEETFAVLNCRYANDLSGTLALRLQKYGGGDEYHAMKGFIPRHPQFVPAFKAKAASRTTFLTEQYMYIAASQILPLQITREFEQESSKLKFWVPLLDSPFRIVEVYPEGSWDQHDGIMHAAENPIVRGGVTIESVTGSKYSLGFGFDLAAVDGEQESRFLPGIWGTRWTGSDSLKEACESNRQCYHTEECAQGYCPWMPASVTVYEYPETVKLECQISKATIMDDIVFVVKVRISEVFEFHAPEPPVELDATAVLANGTQDDLLVGNESEEVNGPNTPDTPNTYIIPTPGYFGPDGSVYSSDIYTPLPSFVSSGVRSSAVETLDHSLFDSNPFAPPGTDATFRPTPPPRPHRPPPPQWAFMAEMDAVESERKLLKPSKSNTKQHTQQNTQQVILASVAPPLQYLLTPSERSCSVQVYVRIPAALVIKDRAPEQARKLGHRIMFYGFNCKISGSGDRLAIGGIVLGCPSWQRLVLAFYIDPTYPSDRCHVLLREISAKDALEGVGARMIRRQIRPAGVQMSCLADPFQESLLLPLDLCTLHATVRRQKHGEGIAVAIDLHLEKNVSNGLSSDAQSSLIPPRQFEVEVQTGVRDVQYQPPIIERPSRPLNIPWLSAINPSASHESVNQTSETGSQVARRDSNSSSRGSSPAATISIDGDHKHTESATKKSDFLIHPLSFDGSEPETIHITRERAVSDSKNHRWPFQE